MLTQGSFGYKIGKKTRLMHVQYDADLLWQTCVREIYILMKHYGSIELLKEAFTNLKDAKGNPKKEAIESCKYYTDLSIEKESLDNWFNILNFCQHSFINILDSDYFLNDGNKQGFVFILDFNAFEAIFYGYDWNPNTQKYDKKTIHEKATIDEIMEFEEMPTKSMTEILTEMKDRYLQFSCKLEKIKLEKERIQGIINKAKELGSDHNILERANKLMYDIDIEKTKLSLKYEYFYNRMDALNLIDHTIE
jgi:hypothetical protein